MSDLRSSTRSRLCAVAVLAAGLAAGARAFAQLAPDGAPNFGTVQLEPGFDPDPQSVPVVAGGSIDARAVTGGACKGFISAEPDVVMVATEALAWLRVYVTSPTDTTLLIRREDGAFLCADDTYGLAPALDASFAPGRYAIWIGAYRAETNARAHLWFTRSQQHHP